MHKTTIRSNTIHELRGWPVPLLGHQPDSALPYKLMRGTNRDRHVAFAALSTVALRFDNLLLGLRDVEVSCRERMSALGEVCALLRDRRPKEVIAATFGACPPGYLGALARTSPRVQPIPYYRRLFDSFADPLRRPEARTLRHVPEIDLGVLVAVRELPPALRHPDVLAFVRDGARAGKIATAVRLLSPLHPMFGDERQVHAAAAACPDVRNLVIRAVQNIGARLPPPPVQLPGFRHLETTADLRTYARRWRCCLNEAWMRAACISGQRAVFQALDYPVLVEIGRLQKGGVTLLGIAGVANEPIPAHMHAAIKARLFRSGVQRGGGPLLRSEWDVIDEIETELRREERSSDLDFDVDLGLDFLTSFETAAD